MFNLRVVQQITVKVTVYCAHSSCPFILANIAEEEVTRASSLVMTVGLCKAGFFW